MKIVYLIHWNYQPNSGVLQKITFQASEWKTNGNDVSICAYYPEGSNVECLKNIGSDLEVKIISYSPRNIISRMYSTLKISLLIEKMHPEIIYWRVDPFEVGFKKLFANFAVVAECNLSDSKSKLRGHIRNWSVRRGLKAASHIIVLTDESLQHPLLKNLKHKSSVIPNSVIGKANEINKTTKKKLIMVTDKRRSIDGIDRMIKLAEIMKDWCFIIIGIPNDEVITTQKNVECLGRLDEDQIGILMKDCRAGLSVFAQDRSSFMESCALKNRLYVKNGLPIIAGHRDTDYYGKEFFYQIQPTDWENITKLALKLRSFLGKWENKRVLLSDIAFSAGNHREKIRLSLMQSVLESNKKEIL